MNPARAGRGGSVGRRRPGAAEPAVARGRRPTIRDRLARHERAVASILLSTHLALVLWGAAANSVTFDESFHLPSGVLIAARGDFSISPYNPPLAKALFALPALAVGARLPDPEAVATGDQRVAGESFMRRNADRYHRTLFAARVGVALISVSLGALVWRFARRLYGPAGGLLALAFYAFAPEALAHGGLATVDVATAFALVASIYAFWGFSRTGRWSWWAWTALAVGVAALVRFSSAILAPVLLALALLGTARGWFPRPARVWLGLALLLATSLAALQVGYLGRTSLEPLGQGEFVSATFRGLGERLPGLRLPLPDWYVRGLDVQAREGEAGVTPSYLLGRIRSEPVWYYFPLALLFKWPLGFLGAVVARGVTARSRGARVSRRRHEAFLLVPAGMLLGWAMFLFNLNIGIRYMFPLVPLLCVWLGGLAPVTARVASRWAPRARLGIATGAVLACLQGVEAGACAPWHLAFFNWPSGGPGGGYRLLNDSNVDWGQGLIALRHELGRRGIRRVHLTYHGTVDPAIYGIDSVPYLGGSPGPESDWIAVSSYYFVGLWQRMTTSRGRTDPVRIDFRSLWGAKPVATPAGCMYLFPIARGEPVQAPARGIGGP